MGHSRSYSRMAGFVGPIYDIIKKEFQKDTVRYINDVSGPFNLCIGSFSQPVQQYYESSNLGRLVTIKWGGKSATFAPQAGLQYVVQPNQIKLVGGGSIPWN